jgi:hypothetical protein
MAGDEWRERCLVVFYDYRGEVACRGLSSRFGGKQTKTNNRGCEAGWLAGRLVKVLPDLTVVSCHYCWNDSTRRSVQMPDDRSTRLSERDSRLAVPQA